MSVFEMSGDGVRGLATSLREGSEQAARAGVSLSALGADLPTPAAGVRLDGAINALSASWTDVLEDVVAGLAELGRWMDDAAEAAEDADDTIWEQLLGIFR